MKKLIWECLCYLIATGEYICALYIAFHYHDYAHACFWLLMAIMIKPEND